MTYMAPEHLLERLASEDCSPADVEEFLLGQGNAAPGFFRGEQDLEEYRQARGWWPTKDMIPDLPGLLVCPSMFQLCYGCSETDPRIGATFQARLLLAAHKLGAWLGERGIDPKNPAESPKERKARSARTVRVADTGAEQRALYDAYLQACAERKAAYAEATLKVEAAHAAWEASKKPTAL